LEERDNYEDIGVVARITLEKTKTLNRKGGCGQKLICLRIGTSGGLL
jgi:hypothetical protein